MRFCEKYTNRVNSLIVEDMDFAPFKTSNPLSYYINQSDQYKVNIPLKFKNKQDFFDKMKFAYDEDDIQSFF